MSSTKMHPNTKAMLQAWQRMTSSTEDIDGGPSAQDYPGLLARLFVIDASDRNHALFRIAGDDLPVLLGRKLIGTDFLDLWTGSDRALVQAIIGSLLTDDRPGLIRGFGEASTGARMDIEVTLAPLGRTGTSCGRLLGLYQSLGGDAQRLNRPVFIHGLKSVYLSEGVKRTRLRLVTQGG